jgi:hypothetical protein
MGSTKLLKSRILVSFHIRSSGKMAHNFTIHFLQQISEQDSVWLNRKGNEQTFKEIRRKVATQSSFQERDSSKSRSEMERMMQSIEDLQSRQAEFEKALEQKEAEKLLIYQVVNITCFDNLSLPVFMLCCLCAYFPPDVNFHSLNKFINQIS